MLIQYCRLAYVAHRLVWEVLLSKTKSAMIDEVELNRFPKLYEYLLTNN
jgi:hypothetical protein